MNMSYYSTNSCHYYGGGDDDDDYGYESNPFAEFGTKTSTGTGVLLSLPPVGGLPETCSCAHHLFDKLRNSIYKRSWNFVQHILTLVVNHNNTMSTRTRSPSEKSYNYFTVNGIDTEDQIDILRHILLGSESSDTFIYANVDATMSTGSTLPSPSFQDIVAMLIQALDVSSHLPATSANFHDVYFDGDAETFCPPYIVSTPEPQGTSLLIELCMDSNHFGVQQLLQALPPTVASVEVQRTDYVFVEYMEHEVLHHQQQQQQQAQQDVQIMPMAALPSSGTRGKMTTSIKEFHFFHTPLQAAWEGILYHRDEFSILPLIQNMNDLLVAPPPPIFSNGEQQQCPYSNHKDIQILWRTTLHLLEAVSGAPEENKCSSLPSSPSHSISSSPFSCPSSWNVIHTIIKIGHKAHSAVLWMALRLYGTNLLTVRDSNGNLPIHTAATSLIYYKSVRAQLHSQNKCDQPFVGQSQINDALPNSDNKRKRKHDTFCRTDEQLKLENQLRSRNDVSFRKSMNSATASLFKSNLQKDEANCLVGNRISQWDQPPILHILRSEEGRRTASIPDGKGRLPLHLLLSNHDMNHSQLEGINTFFDQNLGDDREQIPTTSNKRGYAMDSAIVVRELVNAYPNSVHCVDPTNGFYPFFTAASSKTLPLDVVYFLLSQNLDILTV